MQNGDYATDYQTNSVLYLNDLWMNILGLEKVVQVPKSARYARERMSWRNIAGVFYVDEDEISKSASIVIKDSAYEDTPLLASLYFLLTGDCKEGVAEILDPKKAAARKQGILEFIEERADALRNQRTDYIIQMEQISGTDIEKEMQEITDQIRDTKQEIDQLVEESKSIAQQTLHINRRYQIVEY